MPDSLDILAERFARLPYAATVGMRVESIDLDRVRVRVPFRDENANPGGALHGGVAASAIEAAGSLAAWTGLEARPDLETGTVDLSVNYLAAAIGEDIIASAEVLRRGKEIVYADVDVHSDAGKRVAKGLVTYRALDRAAVPQAAQRQRRMAAERLPAGALDVPRNARVFVAVPFIARLGMTVTHARDGEAFLAMPFHADNADGDGRVHEGALAALIDTSGAMASWSITGLNFSYKASTVGIHLNFHAPALGEDVLAHARTLRRDNEIFLNGVTVSGCRSGCVVATGSVTYRIVVND